LAALTEEGRAHRLESINAYVSCQHSHADHAPILAICDDCGSVEEHADECIMERLSAIARQNWFHARAHVVEMRGQCAECAA
jgi:Fur family zinc uptake transcriptional regulator